MFDVAVAVAVVVVVVVVVVFLLVQHSCFLFVFPSFGGIHRCLFLIAMSMISTRENATQLSYKRRRIASRVRGYFHSDMLVEFSSVVLIKHK